MHSTSNLTQARAQALLRRGKVHSLHPGQSCQIEWKATSQDQTFDHLPTPTIIGRLIFVRLSKPGFRPIVLYLFTNLLDEERYPLTDIVTLYGHRWQVEVDLRHVKTTMHMESFDVQSAALFRKELSAGLLAYNLVCAFMAKASQRAHVKPVQLSFSSCLRRVRRFLHHDSPQWLDPASRAGYLLDRLAKCTLAIQPTMA